MNSGSRALARLEACQAERVKKKEKERRKNRQATKTIFTRCKSCVQFHQDIIKTSFNLFHVCVKSILYMLPIHILIGTSQIWIQWHPLNLIKLIEISLHFAVLVFKDFMKSILALECFGKDDISMKSSHSHKCRKGSHSFCSNQCVHCNQKSAALYLSLFHRANIHNGLPTNILWEYPL